MNFKPSDLCHQITFLKRKYQFIILSEYESLVLFYMQPTPNVIIPSNFMFDKCNIKFYFILVKSEIGHFTCFLDISTYTLITAE